MRRVHWSSIGPLLLLAACSSPGGESAEDDPASPESSESAIVKPFAESVITIADGTGTGPHAFPATLQIKVGTTLRVRDDDTSSPHEVHSDGVSFGYPHQPGPMTAGQSYAATVTAPGTFHIYCHVHGPFTGQTVVTVVP